MSRKSTRGISDVVATVIIVAATVAIALIAVAYFTGIVGGATHTQKLQILPVSRICNDNLILELQNTGSKAVSITGIQVGNEYVTINPVVSIGVGEVYTFNISLTSHYTPGSTYHVEAYSTGNVNVISTDLLAYATCPTGITANTTITS